MCSSEGKDQVDRALDLSEEQVSSAETGSRYTIFQWSSVVVGSCMVTFINFILASVEDQYYSDVVLSSSIAAKQSYSPSLR
ncbi:hypothetical protein Tco_1105040 [Tanacetum coccineum]